MCADGTYYAEIAVDVARPLLEHNGKKGKGTWDVPPSAPRRREKNSVDPPGAVRTKSCNHHRRIVAVCCPEFDGTSSSDRREVECP